MTESEIVWIHGINGYRPPSMNKYAEYILKGLESNEVNSNYEIKIDEINSIGVPILKGLVNRFVRYSLHCRNLEGDCFHIQDHANAHLVNVLPRESIKLLTVHDLYGLRFRDYGRKSNLFSPLVIRGIRKADHLIAISEYMKGRIVEKIGYPADGITVIYHGVDHSLYRPVDGAGEVLRKYGLPEGARFILFVGSEIPRKNFIGVLEAFGRLSGMDKDLYLVKVGHAKTTRGREEALEKISELGIEEKVLFTGFIPEEELPYFYNGAAMLLSPSFYEGAAGMHILEAMACGCPVIASTIPQMVELVGDSVSLCDPADVDDIACRAMALLKDERAAEELRQKGIEKAAGFSWSRNAQEHLDVYREVFRK